jgi:hypothetical protein
MKKQQENAYNRFPVASGLSGVVFQKGWLFISNDAEKETSFVDEIDNQTETRQVRNFMIGRVDSKNKQQPLGVIQFINKRNGQPIGAEDRKKFEDMKDLIGLCIENTGSITETVNVTLMINESMRKIQQIMQEEKQQEDTQPNMQILQELNERFEAIKATTEKLIKDRQKERPNASIFEQSMTEFRKHGFD